MSNQKRRQHETLKADGTEGTPAVSVPEARGYFGISFCILGIIMIVVGACLTFQWMAAPGDSRFLGSGDTWQYYGPTASFMDHCIHNGEFPQWNPLYFCGQPFAANPQSFLFYPPNLIRSLLTFNPTPLKTHTGIAVLVILQLLLGGMSAFFLARRHVLSYGAALVAAFAFVFSAPLVTRATGHWIFLNSVCWLPLTLLLLNHALSRNSFRRRISYSAGAALSWGMTILGGVPFLMVLAGLTMGLYALLFRLLHPFAGIDRTALDRPFNERKNAKARKGTTALSRSTGNPRWSGRLCWHIGVRDVAVLALMLAGGIVIAAPLLLPAVEFSGHTERANKSDDAHEDFAPVEAGWDFVRMLIVYQGHGHYEGIRSSGAIVFMLALVALVYRPKRDTALFGVILLVLLDCSLSKPLLFGRMLSVVAPFQIGNPGRAMIVACLPLGLLAGFGTDAVLESLASVRRRLFRSAAILLAGLLVVLVVALAKRPEPVLAVGLPVVLLPACACVAALVAGWLPEPIIWGTVLSMLVLGETLAWNRELIPAVVPEESRCPCPMEQLAKPAQFWSNNVRGTDLKPNLSMYQLEGMINGYDPMHLREVRDVLCTTPTNKAFRRVIYAPEPTSLNCRGNLFLKRPFWLARQYVNGPLPEKDEMYPAATTVFLNQPGPLPVRALARSLLSSRGVPKDSSSISLYPRTEPPIVLLSQDIAKGKNVIRMAKRKIPPLQSSLFLTVAGSGDLTLLPMFQDVKTNRLECGRQLTLQLRDAREYSYEIPMPDVEDVQVIIKPEFKSTQGELRLIEASIASDPDDENARIRVVSRRANEVEIEVTDLPDARILLFVDAFYPGWRAYVDGRSAPILRANDVFKAVAVPGGTHRVQFVFHSWRVTVGVGLSAACMALFAGLFLWNTMRSRVASPPAFLAKTSGQEIESS